MTHRMEERLDTLQRLLHLSSAYPFARGIHETGISFVSLLKADQPSTIQSGIFQPGICVVLQGDKTLIIRNNTYHYGVGDYIASNIDMPIKGQVSQATYKMPYIAIRISFSTDEIATVALDAKIKGTGENRLAEGAFIGRMGIEALRVIERLLQLDAESSQAAAFLQSSVKQELIFRLLTDEDGSKFYNNMLLHHDAAGISKAIHYVKLNFAQSISVDDIAQAGGISPSTLHHKFKAITSLSPIQYQKQLRLQEARRILLAGDKHITTTAFEVGYESMTQFSREYKRFFGQSPLKDIRAIRVQAKTDGMEVAYGEDIM
ncbi:AraC family transcriptional regulator [Paenibacillus sp. HB172176]|uniref:AraC family transcriptional regulator n=1 Tax=Paenibacillus sp. HB172176 TaxID=2493690 RepID=UPI00143C57F2|nr:AraC family transcriptional regulator [Paenibacillus sp. HB172176]